MSNTSEDKVIREQILFDFEDGVKEFEKLRWNRNRTKMVLSPDLTAISECPSFHKLIQLCSEHDPTILKSVLQDALERCTEAEKRMNEEKESKKREAEAQLGSETQKKSKVQHLGKATTAISQQSRPKAISPPLRCGVTAKLDPRIASEASIIRSASPVMAQASTSSRCQSLQDTNRTGSILSPGLDLASSSEDLDATCDKRSRVEDIQNWTGSEYDLDSEEDMEYESDVHGGSSIGHNTAADTESHNCNSTTRIATMSPDTTSNESELFVPNPVVDANQSKKATLEPSSMPHPLRSSVATESNGSELFVPNPVVDADESMKATLEPSSMPSPVRSSVTTSPPSQGYRLSNDPTKTKSPTIYEVELGLVRGYENIKEYVMGQCSPFSSYYRANRYLSKEDELQSLFHICRKLPLRIVKAWLLRELESRIAVPGQKTAIPSTADLINPSDILDALQSIKMTTINAKVNRAYGQMRLYKSVQGKIAGGYVPDKALKYGVAAHTSILGMMACRSAGKVSEKERTDRMNSFNYEYDAGKKWLDVAKWFGGEGIVLIFVTAGVVNSVVTQGWTKFQRVCMEVISDYLPSMTGLVSVLGEDALDDYCRFGYLEREKMDAVVAFKGCCPPVTETEEDSAGDEHEMGEA